MGCFLTTKTWDFERSKLHDFERSKSHVLMVKNGMTPMQAIESATRVASECVGIESDVGTLQVGKYADLIVLDGNPLDDISIMSKKTTIRMIMQEGVEYKNSLLN